MVQLEVELEDGVWKPVIRCDCAHNFAHRDRYNLNGDHDKEDGSSPFILYPLRIPSDPGHTDISTFREF